MIDTEKYVKIISSQTEKSKAAESVGVEINNQDITITENGVYTADAGYTGIGTATVNVPQSQPVIQSLSITPTTSQQTITATGGVNGYSPITVSAVTSSIDENIIAGNIRNGVSILGVTGNMNPAPEIYRVFAIGSADKLYNSTSVPFLPLPQGVKNLDNYVFYCAYKGTPSNILNGTIDLSSLTDLTGVGCCQFMFADCSGITSINLSSLLKMNATSACANMFSNCTSLTTINLSSLKTITSDNTAQSMFSNCTSLTTVNLSSLETVGFNSCAHMFYGCTGLTSANLSSLKTITSNTGCQSMFSGCSNLTSVDLSSLTNIAYATSACQSMFKNCTSLTRLDFPALTSTSFGTRTNQFDNMLEGVTGCTVHFSSNLQSVIGSWSSVVNGFGGTNTTVLFDLTATS